MNDVRKYWICIDFAEAYGNLGEEAMLLNAIDRLEANFGNCEFILPAEPGYPLPNLPSSVKVVESPRKYFLNLARIVHKVYRILDCIPLVRRCLLLNSNRNMSLWRNVDRIAKWILPLLLRLPTPTARVVRMMQECDMFYGVGSGSFNDYNVSYYVYRTWLYRMLKNKVKLSVLSSHGFGPNEDKWANMKMKEGFQALDIMSFRDCQYSEQLVDDMQLTNTIYATVCDEAFSLVASDSTEVELYLQEARLPKHSTFIAFHYRGSDCLRKTEDTYPKVASLLDRLCEVSPHYIMFLPMSYHQHSTHDVDCGQAICRLMRHPERFLQAPLCKNVRTIKGAVGRAHYAIALSYHINVFALSQGRPAIFIYTGDYYRYKVDGLLGFYGDQSRAFDLQKSSPEDVVASAMHIDSNYDSEIGRISKISEQILSTNDWHLRQARARLDAILASAALNSTESILCR